jgi:hypothetical protein
VFVQEDFDQSEPDVVTMAMTQLLLKAGLKAWDDKAHNAACDKRSSYISGTLSSQSIGVT